MKKTLTLAALLLGTTVMATAAQAETTAESGFVTKQAGQFLVRARVIDVDPQTSTSSVSVIGGKVNVTDQIAPEVDLSYFITNNIAVEAIAASTRHVASVTGSKLSAGKVNVGSVWVLPPTVTVQYHFMTQSRFSPYLGAGISVDWFYNSTPMSGLNRISFTNAVGPALQAGFDYALDGHWSLNADIKQIFINTTASVNSGFVKAKTALNPTVFGVGVGYRF